MKDEFFEGKDFEGGEFKALMPKYYPLKYKKYIEEETELLKLKLKGTNRILEAGVGIGRLIPEIAPIVKEFVGIDNADLMLKKSQEVAKQFSNVKIMKGELENLSKLFPQNHFDFSLCVWNTLGNVKDEVQILKEIAQVTKKSIFITVYHKGTLEDRKNWYKTVNVKISKIDEKNEIFYSESGLKSKSYSLEEIEEIAKASNLQVKVSRILGNVILWVELASQSPKK
jgi:ubiquinone/menaquinone biosynthesis C-methylase UbiE